MHLGLGYQVLDDLEEFLGLDQGKLSKKTSVTLPRIYANHYGDDAARELCIKVIEDHNAEAKKALYESSAREDIKSRLESIVDEMTCRGLQRCRLQESLC